MLYRGLGAIFCIVLCSGFQLCATAQQRMTSGVNVPVRIPRASIDVLQFQGPSSDSNRVDVYIALPYSSLSFLFAGDKYVASYSVDIVVKKKEENIIVRSEFYSPLESIEDYRNRIAGGPGRADAEQISFLLAPDNDYAVQLTVRDLSSKIAFDTTIPLHVRDFHAERPAMSDLILYSDRISSDRSGINIVPFIGPDVTEINEVSSRNIELASSSTSGIFAMLYHIPPDSTFGVVSEIVQENTSSDTGSVVVSKVAMQFHAEHTHAGLTAPSAIPVVPLFFPMPFSGLWPGRLTLWTFLLPSLHDTSINTLSDLKAHALAFSKREIIVRIASGIPISLTDLDEAIEQLQSIASNSEWDSLSAARTPKEKRDAVVQFWREKGIGNRSAFNSALAERPMKVFYVRLEYANLNYGSALGPGWKSDRGKVYIALGAPDNIERSDLSGMQQPYEIWKYAAQDAQYIFVDKYQLGDYRLRGSFPPEGTFIWDR